MNLFGVSEREDGPAEMTFLHDEEETVYVAGKLSSRGKPEVVQDFST